VPGKILAELKQTRPFTTLEEEAFVNVLRTASVLSHEMAELLRGYDLTQTQYNVLRILRGAGAAGLNASDIGNRMITREPDVTRLLDRLEKRSLVERWRCTEDRRVVWTRITDAGLDLIAGVAAPGAALLQRQLGHLGSERLRLLIELLEEAREADRS
jgi:DNA-binding MarR family transcriptional regulator